MMKKDTLPAKPSKRPKSTLVGIVETIQEVLWLDRDEDEVPFWNKDKEWTVGSIEDVADALIRAGLRPPVSDD